MITTPFHHKFVNWPYSGLDMAMVDRASEINKLLDRWEKEIQNGEGNPSPVEIIKE